MEITRSKGAIALAIVLVAFLLFDLYKTAVGPSPEQPALTTPHESVTPQSKTTPSQPGVVPKPSIPQIPAVPGASVQSPTVP